MTKYTKMAKLRCSAAGNNSGFHHRKLNLSFNNKSRGIIAAVLIVGAIFTYLIQINKMATKGFELRALEDQIAQLQEDNKRLELKAIDLQATSYVANNVKKLGLIQADEITYLDANDTSFVQR